MNENLQNLSRVWKQADAEDLEAARNAFPKYQRLVTAIAERYGYSTSIGAAVFAALSPNSDYWGNLRDTDRLLAAASAGKQLDEFKVSTYGNNKLKAWRIAHGEKPEDLIVALKTRSFFHNIRDPNCRKHVTIDGHMHNIWFNKLAALTSRVVKVSPKLYMDIAEGVRQMADAEGLVPCQLQATLWLTWRRIHIIRTPAQREMWDRDYLAAGLGFVRS